MDINEYLISVDQKYNSPDKQDKIFRHRIN
jgi:hypothetical protein